MNHVVCWLGFLISSFHPLPISRWALNAWEVVLWQEGLLIDYLQKLSTHNALRKIVNSSFTLITEKCFFDFFSRQVMIFCFGPMVDRNHPPIASLKFSLFTLILAVSLIIVAPSLTSLTYIIYL